MFERPIRKQFIDYDARRKPRTKLFCVKCQKDLSPGKHVRRAYVTRDMEASECNQFCQPNPRSAHRRRSLHDDCYHERMQLFPCRAPQTRAKSVPKGFPRVPS